MAFYSDIAAKLTETLDTINTCFPDPDNVGHVASNQYDQQITSDICQTVAQVGLYACIAIVACFLITVLSKAYAKKKELELEKERLRLKEECDKAEREWKGRREAWELKKKQEAWELEQQRARSDDMNAKGS